MRILIVCTGNSCRSQMAEYYLKALNSNLEVFSAGSRPELEVNPLTKVVMQEDGIDLSNSKPSHIDEFIRMQFDYVITVCGNAKESCPTFIGKVKHLLHIGFEDPAKAYGSESEVLDIYREIRDQIKKQFFEFYHQQIKNNL